MKRLALFLLFPAMLLAQSSNPTKPGGVNGDPQCKSGSKFVACSTSGVPAKFSSIIVGNGLPADATVVVNKEAQWDSTNHVLTLCSTAPCDTILRAIANTADGTGTGGCGGGGTNGAGKQCVWRAGGNGITVTLTAGTNTEGGMVTPNAAGTVDYAGLYGAVPAESPVIGQLINTPGGSGGTATAILFPWFHAPGTTATVTASTPITVSTRLQSAIYLNQHATAGTAIVYNLPATQAGKQFCFTNSYNGSAANTGTITITPAASSYIISKGVLSTVSKGWISAGAAGDSACVVGTDATHWTLYISSGTWTAVP